MSKKADKQTNKGSMGGIPFFFSLLSLLILFLINISYLPLISELLWSENSAYLICGMTIGAWFAYAAIAGAPSVFIHELKHSIMSNLAGNRARDMKVKRKTGHFTYEYTEETAKYNALIALAPYFLPIFTFVAAILVLVFLRHEHLYAVALIAFGFGVDLNLNFRDVSPIQTDLTRITGGYRVGVCFVLAINLTMATFLIIWALSDWVGIKGLIQHMLHIFSAVFFEIKQLSQS